MTLDVVEIGLKDASIKFLRFDGKVPQKERKGIVDKFRKDPSFQVLLLTLSSGAVGLVMLLPLLAKQTLTNYFSLD